jgi:hypothetical protein
MSNKQSVDMKFIKEHEKKQRAKIAAHQDEDRCIDFDQWWIEKATTLKQPQHIKEILRVDAAARGLTDKQSIDKWDWAAKQFGLNI